MEAAAAAPPPPPSHVALLPSPGMGHLIPLVAFAKRLVHHHPDFLLTFYIPTVGPPSKAQKATVDSLPSSVNAIFLNVSLDDVGGDAKAETVVCLTVLRCLPSLREELKRIPKVAALVVDLFATDAFDVAKELDIPPYIFFPSTAMCLSLIFHLEKLDQTIPGEYRDLPEPVLLPGCIPLHGRDLLDPLQDRTNEGYKWVLHHAKRFKLADGIMINSFVDLEGGPLKVLQQDEPGRPPVYPVGPLVNMGGSTEKTENDSKDEECLRWLDDQPLGSVLFVSFGSGGTLTHEQLNELASGLEMSERRFLWVVRSPSDAANANFFSAESQKDPFDFLPQGFLERTEGRGLVVPSWAPQSKVLSHGSTGGFVCHCGWNSVLESVVNGVPLIAWPLYAEQKMNAVMLSEGIKVALRPKAEKGVVGRHEVCRVVKSLMEGEEGKGVRSRMKELKDAAATVVGEDGPSTKALSQVASKWLSR